MSSSSIYLIGVVPGSGTDSDLDSTGNAKVGILTSPLSMAR